jgi:hypothetical protein
MVCDPGDPRVVALTQWLEDSLVMLDDAFVREEARQR